MTLNLRSESQVLLILEIFFLFIQAVIIINVANFNVEEINILSSKVSDQVMISLNVEVLFFQSSTYVLFKNVTFFIFVILVELKITSLILILSDFMKKHFLNSTITLAQHQTIIMNIIISSFHSLSNSTITLAQHQTIIMNIIISSFHSLSNYTNIIVENLLKTKHYAVLNKKIKSACTDVKREER